MNTRFDICFEHTVGLEGGYVNDPHDPGGETMWGITRRDHPDLWLKGVPTIEQAKQRYYEQYWLPPQCDKLAAPFDMLVFDAAVNQGIRPAVRIVQRALDLVDDGIVGPKTIAACRAANVEQVAMALAQRARAYAITRGFDRFGLGWLKRTYIIAIKAAHDLPN
jgi:lysozyme family protein